MTNAKDLLPVIFFLDLHLKLVFWQKICFSRSTPSYPPPQMRCDSLIRRLNSRRLGTSQLLEPARLLALQGSLPHKRTCSRASKSECGAPGKGNSLTNKPHSFVPRKGYSRVFAPIAKIFRKQLKRYISGSKPVNFVCFVSKADLACLPRALAK